MSAHGLLIHPQLMFQMKRPVITAEFINNLDLIELIKTRGVTLLKHLAAQALDSEEYNIL